MVGGHRVGGVGEGQTLNLGWLELVEHETDPDADDSSVLTLQPGFYAIVQHVSLFLSPLSVYNVTASIFRSRSKCSLPLPLSSSFLFSLFFCHHHSRPAQTALLCFLIGVYAKYVL